MGSTVLNPFLSSMLRSAKDLFYGKRGSNILPPEGWDCTAAF